MEKNINIYNSEENCNIKAKIYYKENKINQKIFIFCHGFCSGKESKSVSIVANKLLEKGISSIAFDFPGHGDSVQSAEKLTTKICISYINSVIEYIRKEYGEKVKISFFAISFGAYILLNKLIGDNSKYENNGKAKAGHGGKIEVPYTFYEDLEANNLYKNYKEKRKILIIQGKLDDTAPIEDTYRFIKNKPEIELIEMENMKHHMSPEEIETISNIIINKLLI